MAVKGNSTVSIYGTALTFSLLTGSLALQVGDAFTVISSTAMRSR